MTEEEIRGLIEWNLENCEYHNAIMLSYKRIGLAALKPFFHDGIRRKAKSMLWNSLDANSKLALFMGLPGGTKINLPEYLPGLLVVYKQWENAFRYLFLHYDDPRAETFRKKFSKEQVLFAITHITAERKLQEKKFENTKTIAISPDRFSLMRETFLWLQVAILGEDSFMKFSAEFNRGLAILRGYQREEIPPKGGIS